MSPVGARRCALIALRDSAEVADQPVAGNALRVLLKTRLATNNRIDEAARDADHPHALMALNNWANVDYARADYASALPRHREVQQRRRRSLPTNDPDLAQSATNVAKCLWRLGQIDAAAAELDAAPAPTEVAAQRSQRLLRAHLMLARGHAQGALAAARPLRAETEAAAPQRPRPGRQRLD